MKGAAGWLDPFWQLLLMRLRTFTREPSATFWVFGFPLLMYLLQDSLIFHPQRLAEGQRLAISKGSSVESVLLDAADGTRLHAWHVKGDPLILYFGGNAEEVSWMLDAATRRTPGAGWLLVDYRGYGSSDGAPSEKALVADALQWYDHFKSSASRIYVFGRSLGSGVAVQLAAQRPDRLRPGARDRAEQPVPEPGHAGYPAQPWDARQERNDRRIVPGEERQRRQDGRDPRNPAALCDDPSGERQRMRDDQIRLLRGVAGVGVGFAHPREQDLAQDHDRTAARAARLKEAPALVRVRIRTNRPERVPLGLDRTTKEFVGRDRGLVAPVREPPRQRQVRNQVPERAERRVLGTHGLQDRSGQLIAPTDRVLPGDVETSAIDARQLCAVVVGAEIEAEAVFFEPLQD